MKIWVLRKISLIIWTSVWIIIYEKKVLCPFNFLFIKAIKLKFTIYFTFYYYKNQQLRNNVFIQVIITINQHENNIRRLTDHDLKIFFKHLIYLLLNEVICTYSSNYIRISNVLSLLFLTLNKTLLERNSFIQPIWRYVSWGSGDSNKRNIGKWGEKWRRDASAFWTMIN